VHPNQNTVTVDAVDPGVFTPVVGAPTSDAFTVNATLGATAVDDGTPVTVDAQVASASTAETTVLLDLVVDGDVVETEQVAVGPGANETANFTNAFDPGRYDVAVSGAHAGTLTVRDVTAPVPDAVTRGDRWIGHAIEFDASGSSDDVGVVTYEWNFGDGATATGETASHTYWRVGTYAVTVRVTDAAGNAETLTKDIHVWWPPSTGSASTSASAEPRVEVERHGDSRAMVAVTNAVTEPNVSAEFGFGPADAQMQLERIQFATTDRSTFQVAVDQTAGAPHGVPAWNHSGHAAFGYFVVEAPDGSVGPVTHRFSVSTTALDARGLEPADVVLYHFVDDEWVALETRATGLQDGAATFAAETPSLSVFAVGTTYPEMEVTERTLATTELTTGDALEVTTSLSNEGSADGEHVVELALDGRVVETERVVVAAGASETVTLTHALDRAGAYDVSLDGESVGTVHVTDPAPTTTLADAADEEPAADRPDDPGTGTSLAGVLLFALGALIAGYLLFRQQ
jgi:PKD repeat protein